MIDGVQLKPLKIIRDARGQVMHMMRCDDGVFTRFGEIYFSVINPDVVKGWKKHQKMTMHFAVPVGDIRLVIYDNRLGSPTRGEVQQILVGEENYQLVCIPPAVWYSVRSENDHWAMIANCSDIPHDPNEIEEVPIGSADIPYVWT
ncbi:MAG: dTDP-4-dehydrorhamnose 3,5-epimerase family protein [Candidatus Omnitrophica bacterium]|nr:dTDP-4-dehydrorhamnose 3,5-epimerase family protein [Candidatus Omnitrophota bacterium]